VAIAPDPKFTQPWHGVPRQEITWQPSIEPDLCNGCGLCVTGCGRSVFRYDYDARKSVVVAPDQCMVGCQTCANTCPQSAISFPPLSSLKLLIRRRRVLQEVKKVELEDRQRFALLRSAEGDSVPSGPDTKAAAE
jgi:CDP-4-dehydro-6-deoxyglucose reductase